MSKPATQAISSLIVVLLSANAAADDWKEMPIKIVGVENYFAENCIPVEAGQQVRYRFTSPYPLDFNVHHHTLNTTEFEVKEEQITGLHGDFSSAVDQEYCFMWTNKKELGNEWVLILNYQTSEEQLL